MISSSLYNPQSNNPFHARNVWRHTSNRKLDDATFFEYRRDRLPGPIDTARECRSGKTYRRRCHDDFFHVTPPEWTPVEMALCRNLDGFCAKIQLYPRSGTLDVECDTQTVSAGLRVRPGSERMVR